MLQITTAPCGDDDVLGFLAGPFVDVDLDGSVPAGGRKQISNEAKEDPSSHFPAVPSHINVRANQFPRSVSRAEPFRLFVVTVSIPSRARSAVVMPDTGLPPGAPCQTSFLLSPPALKQATNALLLLGDRSAMGACLSPGAKKEGYITRLPGAVSTALSLSVVISASLNTAKSLVGNNTAGALGP